MKRSMWAVAVVLTLATLAAAQAPAPRGGAVRPLPEADQREIEKHLGTGVVGAAVEAPPLGTIADYFSPSNERLTFQTVQGKDAGSAAVGRFTWLQRRDDSRGWQYDAGGNTVLFGRATKAGTLEVLSSQDRHEGVVSRFSPAEPMLIPGLKAGEDRRAKIAVSVFDLSRPDRQTHSGFLDVAHTYVGSYAVTVPAGKFDAALLRWTYTGKIGPADVSDVQYRFLVKGIGVVAMVEKVDVSAFLVYNDHSRVARVLMKRE